MNVHPNAQDKSIVTEKHYKKLSNWARFVVYLRKFFVKKFHKLCYINIEREVNNFASTGLVWEFRASSPRKFDKWCNLVSSEVLLKLCFIEFYLL